MQWYFEAEDARFALTSRRAFLGVLRVLCSCANETGLASAEVVYGELIANVVRHAPGAVKVTVAFEFGGLITLHVCDTGRPFAVPAGLPTLLADSGRGLYIVSQLCRDVSVTRTAEGNKVSVLLPVLATQLS